MVPEKSTGPGTGKNSWYRHTLFYATLVTTVVIEMMTRFFRNGGSGVGWECQHGPHPWRTDAGDLYDDDHDGDDDDQLIMSVYTLGGRMLVIIWMRIELIMNIDKDSDDEQWQLAIPTWHLSYYDRCQVGIISNKILVIFRLSSFSWRKSFPCWSTFTTLARWRESI